MPQATEELRARWHDDSTALDQLGSNFTIESGLIRPRDGYVPSAADYSAIDYLFQEWDFCYEPEPV